MLDAVKEGDKVIVTRLDRIARDLYLQFMGGKKRYERQVQSLSA